MRDTDPSPAAGDKPPVPPPSGRPGAPGPALPAWVWRDAEEVPEALEGAVVAVGVFDGVHLGHRAILARCRQEADRLGLPVVAVTFDPHPDAVVRPGTGPLLLSTLPHRVRLLRAAGADAVRLLTFTRELAGLPPEEFVDRHLVAELRARAVVVGENFRFGRRAAGDPQTLRELGAARGFTAEAVGLAGSGEVWSSTYVRGLVAGGDVADAAVALARPHRVEGAVVRGDARGRRLGYPTANVDVQPGSAVPADGVYAGWLVLGADGDDERPLPAAVSVGTNPQFDGRERRVEAYVLDRDDLDLYGAHVAVDLAARIRGMWRFDGVEGLVARMGVDVAEARRITGAG